MSSPTPDVADGDSKKPFVTVYDRQAQSLADFFIKGLEDGTSRWLRPWNPQQDSALPDRPYNPTTGKPYRGGNAMTLMAAHDALVSAGKCADIEDQRWLTYKQALAVGAQVRKGEKGVMCVTWKELEDDKRERQGEGVEPSDERKRMVALGFFVFHASQIDGLPERPQREPALPMSERVAAVHRIAEEQGVPVVHRGSQAYYMPAADIIHMPARETFISEDAYAAVLLHELGHATGHESRLNRTFSFDRKGEEYAREELRAEMSSHLASQRLGLAFDPGSHVAYVNSWVKLLKDDPREILRAAGDAERIVTFLKVPEREYEILPRVEREQTREQSSERSVGNGTSMPEPQKARSRGRSR